MAKKTKRKQSQTPPRFAVGDQVRVQPGVMDCDFPDIPVGGWAGKVKEILKGDPPTYLVSWSKRTLDGLPPIYKNRCERDGLDYGQMWLGEEDLGPDEGGPVEIGQPTKIVTKPLDMKVEEDRIRVVFQITSDDPLPDVDFDTLEVYRDFLAKNLTFPFEAVLETETGPFSSRREKVSVTGLGDPEGEYRIDETYGLICDIKIGKQRGDAPLSELEAKKRDPNRQWVEDYCSWFWNYR